MENEDSPALFSGLMMMGSLAVLAVDPSIGWMYLGISLVSAGIGLVSPVIAFLAAATSQRNLGATMGSLAAAGALGQTLGSAVGGWLFGAVARLSSAWLAVPLLAALILVLLRPSWWTRAGPAPPASLAPLARSPN